MILAKQEKAPQSPFVKRFVLACFISECGQHFPPRIDDRVLA